MSFITPSSCRSLFGSFSLQLSFFFPFRPLRFSSLSSFPSSLPLLSYQHSLCLRTQLPHSGRFSSHFFFCFRQATHPFLLYLPLVKALSGPLGRPFFLNVRSNKQAAPSFLHRSHGISPRHSSFRLWHRSHDLALIMKKRCAIR